jgi:GMP synthase-like glutamine amidotransferase
MPLSACWVIAKHNSFDNDPWILKLVEFTEKLLKQNRVRIVEVCFGHQIIKGRWASRSAAATTDGRSQFCLLSLRRRAKRSSSKRLSSVKFALPVNLYQQSQAIHQMHKDIVFEYPEGVEKLGASPRCLAQGIY